MVLTSIASGSSIVGNGRCATEQCKPICVIDDTLSKTSSPAQQHASHSHRSSRLGAGGACVQFNARARSTATRGSPSRPACTAHQVRSARPHSLGGIQSRPLLAFFSLRPAAPPSRPGVVGGAEKGGRRVTFRGAAAPARPGNGVIAPLRDRRGAGPKVKDMRRPPF